MYEWNNAYNYIINIKNEYMKKFHLDKLDTYSLKTMCEKLNTKEYNNFLNCIDTTSYNNLCLVKYSMIKGGDSDLYTNPNSIYREMRGLTIDLDNNEIVLCPFRKFFNINELDETNISIVTDKIAKARTMDITNKLDGSMLSATWYNNTLVLGGTGSLDEKRNERLAECREWFTNGYLQLVKDNYDYTFMFEHISHKDKHIVAYSEQEQGLYLVGARNKYNGVLKTYKELNVLATEYDIPITDYETKSLNELMNSVSDFEGTEKEGWVIHVDHDMYKLKCDDYVQIHYILYALSGNNVVKAIVKGTFDDIISKVPEELRPRIYEYSDVVYEYMRKAEYAIEYYYNQYKDISEQADFGKAIVSNVPKIFRAYMFNKRYGQEYNLIQNFHGHILRFEELQNLLAKINKLDIF